MNPEELLRDAEFVKSLARSLVLDSHRADDFVQDAWVAALRRRPSHKKPLRAWLARVTRNLVINFHRTEKRRQEREALASKPEGLPSTMEMVEKMEQRRLLIESVLKTNEPYRTTIILHFYEGLSPSEIARHKGIPESTVRTQLRRGVSRLRNRLDSVYKGDRNAWRLAIAPLAGLNLTSPSSILTGGALMTLKLKISLTALVMLSIIVCSFIPVIFNPGDSNESPMPFKEIKNSMAIKPDHPAPIEKRDTRDRIASIHPVLTGKVIDLVSKRPVTRYRLRLERYLKDHRFSKIIDEAINHPEGSFVFPLQDAGVFKLVISSSRHRIKTIDQLGISADKNMVVEMDPAMCVSGRVVDHHTNKPIKDAVVVAMERPSQNTQLLHKLYGKDELVQHAITDDQGRFSLYGLQEMRQTIVAVHPDYAEGWRMATPGVDSDVRIQLKEGFCVFGRVLDDKGTPKSGVCITVTSNDIPLHRYTLTNNQGIYRTAPVRPGIVELNAAPPQGETQESFGLSAEWKEARVKDQDVEVNFGQGPKHITWQGTLYGYHGKPVSKGVVYATKIFTDPSEHNLYRRNRRSEICDKLGRFEFRRFLPGRYNIRAVLEDGEWINEKIIFNFEEPGLIVRDINLNKLKNPEYTAGISGKVIYEGAGGPMVKKGVSFVTAFLRNKHFTDYIDETGGYRLENLPEGVYKLMVYAKGYPRAEVNGIVLEKDRTVENFDLRIPAGGELCVRVNGFQDKDSKDFTLELAHERGRKAAYRTYRIGDNGSWENVFALEIGAWKLTFIHDALGVVERECEVLLNQMTTIGIEKKPVEPGLTHLLGRLMEQDGSVLSHIEVQFLKYGDKVKRTITDAEGQFSFPNLKTGRWRIMVVLSGSERVCFPQLVIPERPPSSMIHDLVLPENTVSGEICDIKTGKGIRSKWRVLAWNVKSKENVSEFENQDHGRRFKLKGMPEGEMILEVLAMGYAPFRTRPFTCAGAKELGKIQLEPCGVMEVKVIDPSGNVIKGFDLFCGGEMVQPYQQAPLSEGYVRIDGLPLGEMVFEATASGYEPKKMKVILQAYQPKKLCIVLKGKH